MSTRRRLSQWLRTMNAPAGGSSRELYPVSHSATLTGVRFGHEVEIYSQLLVQLFIGARTVFREPMPVARLSALSLDVMNKPLVGGIDVLTEGIPFAIEILNPSKANVEARPYIIYEASYVNAIELAIPLDPPTRAPARSAAR